MKNDIEDIRPKLIDLIMKCPIMGKSVEVHGEINKYVFHLNPEDPKNNVKVLSKIRK